MFHFLLLILLLAACKSKLFRCLCNATKTFSKHFVWKCSSVLSGYWVSLLGMPLPFSLTVLLSVEGSGKATSECSRPGQNSYTLNTEIPI